MDCGFSRLEIVWLEPDSLAPNPWNPNRMSPENRAKLRTELSTRGWAAPLVVRPYADRYQIVDGEHRWQIARQLGWKKLPCVIVNLDDLQARLKTLQLNNLRGENDPDKLAALLSELAQSLTLESIEALLPWSAEEMEQLLTLLADQTLPDRPASLRPPPERAELDKELFAVAVTEAERSDIERALAAVRQKEEAITEGEALAAVCRAYLAE